MGPPTVAQRIEQLEEKAANIEDSTTEMVAKAVERAMEAMRNFLTELVMENQSIASKNMSAEFEAMTGKLEGRINRSREYHELLINTMRNEQLKFQSEMKSTFTGLQSGQNPPLPKHDASVNHLGLSSPGTVLWVWGRKRLEKGGEDVISKEACLGVI